MEPAIIIVLLLVGYLVLVSASPASSEWAEARNAPPSLVRKRPTAVQVHERTPRPSSARTNRNNSSKIVLLGGCPILPDLAIEASHGDPKWGGKGGEIDVGFLLNCRPKGVPRTPPFAVQRMGHPGNQQE